METVDIVSIGSCALISLVLIARLWWHQKEDRFLKKLFWSVALTLPIGGWFLYGAFYRPPDPNKIRA